MFSFASVAPATRLALLLLLAIACAQALADDAQAILHASVQGTSKELATLQQRLKTAEDQATLSELRDAALDLQSRLREASAQAAPELKNVEARLDELGAAPESGAESAAIAAQRRLLERQRASFSGDIRLSGLLLVELEQVIADIAARRRADFQEKIGDRADSPLGSTFWAALRADLDSNTQRIRGFFDAVGSTLRSVSALAWLVCAVAIAAWIVAGRLAQRIVLRRLPAVLRGAGFHRLMLVLLWTLLTALLAHVIVLTLFAGAPAAEKTVVEAWVPMAAFAAYVATLTRGMLAPSTQGGQLLAVPERVAARLRWFPLQFVAVTVVSAVVNQLASALELAVPISVATDAAMTVLLAGVLANALRTGNTVDIFWRRTQPHAAPALTAAPLWVSIAIGVIWLVLLVSVLATLVGYIALGSFLVKQTAWMIIVASSAYLLMRAADELLSALLHSSHESQATDHTAASASTRRQIAVLLTAAVHVVIMALAAILLLAPYGAGPFDVVRYAQQIQQGLAIGKIQLRPESVIRALIVLVLGWAAVRAIGNWLQQRLLPTTRLDLGMRDSVGSLSKYVGHIVVITLALSALGIGLQQIAWIASALAVGIGFGLQAIVQNFVSGLILLAERPVRVGDWVALGDIEGDIRRINARATEIQRGDRSTIIVPNSEFITKSVRNVTYASALGLVQIKLPLPLNVDVERVRHELLQSLKAHHDVLDNPAPSVMLDGVDGGNLIVNATAFVRSPRVAYGVRSDLLFDVLGRLKRADIA